MKTKRTTKIKRHAAHTSTLQDLHDAREKLEAVLQGRYPVGMELTKSAGFVLNVFGAPDDLSVPVMMGDFVVVCRPGINCRRCADVAAE